MASAKRPSEVVADQLADIRKRRRMTQEQLAAALREAGLSKMDRVTVAKIETAARGLSLDEALAIAAVLGIAPTNLFLPLRTGEDVAITPKRIIPARHARRWVRGQAPLDAEDLRIFRELVADEEWAAMQNTSLQFLLDRVQKLVDATVAEKRDEMADAVDALNDELARMEAAELRRERPSLPESEEVAKEVALNTQRRQETRQERSERRAAERSAQRDARPRGRR